MPSNKLNRYIELDKQIKALDTEKSELKKYVEKLLKRM
jgi:hypothetical protein